MNPLSINIQISFDKDSFNILKEMEKQIKEKVEGGQGQVCTHYIIHMEHVL